LEEVWARSWYPLFQQPLGEIRDYFGEKVAFYFAWLQFYCQWLIFLAIGGVLLWFWQIATPPHPKIDVDILPFCGIVVAVWATLFLEFWKRRESTLRAEWGMTNFVQKEQPRPEFYGERMRSPVDGTLIKHDPFYKRLPRFFLSQLVIGTLIGIVLGSVIGIFFFRTWLIKRVARSAGMTITSIVNAVQIQILNVVYGIAADKLNEYENHRTQSAWENALIGKSFIFKFINSYYSMFYIAFFKRYDSTSGCPPDDRRCMKELSVQLAIIFGAALVVNNIIEILVPTLMNLKRDHDNRVKPADGASDSTPVHEKSDPEKQYELEVYTTIPDFDEMVVQFGYVSLFVVAFPLSPFAALINNYVEIRLDAHKLCLLCQRPSPQGAAGIGTWSDILTITSFISVLVNALICTFNTDIIDKWTHGDVVWKCVVFIVTERVITLLKFTISYAVDDVPREVQDHIEREKYVVDVLINGVVEEELVDGRKDSDAGQQSGVTINYDHVPDKYPSDHPASDPKSTAPWNVDQSKIFGEEHKGK